MRSASPLDGVEVSGPALVGEGVEFGEGVRIDGPAIVGDECRIGDGAYIRDAILLEGPEMPARAMAIGGVAGRVAKP